MLFDSTQVVETLERLYQNRVRQMSENKYADNPLKAMVMAAELDALGTAVRESSKTSLL